jgi:hypothetical protein
MRSATYVAAVAAACCLSGTAFGAESKDCAALKQQPHLQSGALYFRNRDDVWTSAGRGAAEQNSLRSDRREVKLIYFLRRETRTSGALNIRIRNQAYGSGRQAETVLLRRAAINDYCEGIRRTRRALNQRVDVNAYIDYHDNSGSRPEIYEFHIAYRDSDNRCVRTDAFDRRGEFQFKEIDGRDQRPAFHVAGVEKIVRPSLVSRFINSAVAQIGVRSSTAPASDKREHYYTWLVSEIVRYPSLPADGACVEIPVAAGLGVKRTIVSVTDFDARDHGFELAPYDWVFGWDDNGRR